MLGAAVTRPQLEAMEPGAAILSLRGLNAYSIDKLPLLENVDLTVYTHEIVGIASVAGNGQTVLADVLSGSN